jgi:DNA-binding response OmpR family regulator
MALTVAARLRDMPAEDLAALCAYYEDILGLDEDQERVQALKAAFNLTNAPAWVLSRLVAADGRAFSKAALLDQLPRSLSGEDRSEKLIQVYMWRLRKALGADAFETVPRFGYRLTPLGRLRTRRALDPEGAL